MKTPARFGIACLLLGVGGAAALAQAGAAPDGLVTPAERQLQRQHIASERERQQALYRAAEAACYKRFAVTDCLHDARLQRRAALDELRRREVILNDLDRQAQAQATAQRIGQKVGAGSAP